MTSVDHASRNIIIAGASSEIGLALAKYLCDKSDHLILFVSRAPVKSANLVDADHTIYLHDIDFTIEADLQRLRNEVNRYFTTPFTVIHSVGDFWRHKPLIKTELAEVRSMFESHYFTLCGVAHALIPLMINNGGGRLVAFSCNSVSFNYPDMAPFTSAKAAVESFIKCIANEYAEYGIAASALALPTIKTKRVLIEKDTGDHENYITPDELAHVVLDTITKMPLLVNGSVIKVFKYSRTFYHSSYFERNPRSASDEITVQ